MSSHIFASEASAKLQIITHLDLTHSQILHHLRIQKPFGTNFMVIRREKTLVIECPHVIESLGETKIHGVTILAPPIASPTARCQQLGSFIYFHAAPCLT
jgi:hypothetical protein